MSLFANALLKMRRAERWPEIEVTVSSCIWQDDPEGGGITRLTYTYRYGEEIYTGEAVWHCRESQDKYRRDNRIIIRYDPRKPSRSYFPERQDLDAPFIIAFVGGVGFALVMLFLYVIRSGR